MTDLRQAAQQALEALEGWDNYGAWVWPESALEQSKQNTTDSIAALRKALEQPEQEPLEYWNAVEGWVKIDEVREHFDSVGCGTIYKTAGEDRVPLYTTPHQRQWVGLTPEEVKHLYPYGRSVWGKETYEAIEKALKEKNDH